MSERVVITGANRGIGLALTEQFLRNGYQVIATCRQPDQADVLSALSSLGQLSIQTLDVRNKDHIKALATLLSGIPVDILINNAGVMGGEHQSVDDMDENAWLSTFEVNVIAPFQLTTNLVDNLRLSKRPRVIAMSSQMGALSRARGDSYAYRSSKTALNKVMQGLATDLAPQGIIACPVHPGWVKTEMGGSGADITAKTSAAGLFNLIESLTMDHSGKFWSWDGSPHAW